MDLNLNMDVYLLYRLTSLGAATGLLSHWTYFYHGEHHMHAPNYAVASVALPAAIAGIFYRFFAFSIEASVLGSVILAVAFWIGALVSILAYRLVLSPLNQFPGPFGAKVASGYQWFVYARKNRYEWLMELHAKYGDIVRIGPGELSIISMDAVQVIHGPKSVCIRAPWYDMPAPTKSLLFARDKAVHDHRRKIWDLGFSLRALREFEKRQLVYVHQFDSIVAEKAGQPFNATSWFHFLTFDVMGELAFGKPFDNLKTGKEHEAVQIMTEGQMLLKFMGAAPWFSRILLHIPGALAAEVRLREWCAGFVEERKKMTLEEPDVMSHLLDEAKKQTPEEAINWLGGDARLIVVAGSDTTASTLTHIFYYLSKYPEHITKLREALDPLVPSPDEICNQQIQNVSHLDAIINETLRLRGPVPSGTFRITPSQGINCGGKFIPGRTIVSVPQRVICQSEKAFVNPSEFIPERWYSQPELILDKRAYAPFSAGAYSCIGKNIAMMQLRTVVALLVLKYDVDFAPGENGSDLLEKDYDAFTVFLKDFNVVFKPRA